MITCPKCGRQNRPQAKFCRYCGADFSPGRDVPTATRDKDGPPQTDKGLLAGIKQLVSSPAPSSAPTSMTTRPLPAASSASQPTPPITRSLPDQLTPLQRGNVLTSPQHPERRYGIARAREMEHSIYYDAVNLTCSNCQALHDSLPHGGMCQGCQTPLAAVLIHERQLHAQAPHADVQVDYLIRLSKEYSGILPHQDILQYKEHTYTVSRHPGQWGVLMRDRRPRSPDEVLAYVAQVAQALAYLHRQDYAYFEDRDVGRESLITTGGGMEIKLANLSLCTPLPGSKAERQAHIHRDIFFLGSLLFSLATGEKVQRSDIDLAPSALRPFIERAMQEAYASVSEMLSDLTNVPPTSMAARSLKPSHGQATHPGRQHQRNEDAVVTFTFDKEQDGDSVPIGFYLVADGMGGHEAGDVASRTVNQIVTDWVINTKVLPDLRKRTRRLSRDDVPSELLAKAIREANQVLLRRSRAKSSDLGSTVTAALIIGSVATITNVGDSRTYLLRDGRLKQITQDHSLVARLVDAGAIQPEDVRSHPQRNQIYRCLGHDQQVKVDTFTQQLQVGDMLILCSDGLWEMVLNAEIENIIESTPSPQRACDELIAAANRAGGEDNIAVILVRME